MTDRELLELAAKAAGYQMNIVRSQEKDGTVTFYMEPSNLYWNPLIDDGDALRLAVKLRLEVAIHETETGVINGNLIGGIEKHNDDPYAATRRAIVRAAAEIGKSL